MQTNSLIHNAVYAADKPQVELLLDTPFSKEIRICLSKGQEMKRHQTAFPIVVELFEWEAEFWVEEQIYHLHKGDILTLEGGIPHDVKALDESIIRLTLSKQDAVARVEQVAQQSA